MKKQTIATAEKRVIKAEITMSAKSQSPEAAQKKVWKAEIRDHAKAAAKIRKDFNGEERRLEREAAKANKARISAVAKAVKFKIARAKKEPRALALIDRRIAILNGRIGI